MQQGESCDDVIGAIGTIYWDLGALKELNLEKGFLRICLDSGFWRSFQNFPKSFLIFLLLIFELF